MQEQTTPQTVEEVLTPEKKLVQQLVQKQIERLEEALKPENILAMGTNIVPVNQNFRLASGAVYCNVENPGTYPKGHQFGGLHKLPTLRRVNKPWSRRDLIRKLRGKSNYYAMRNAQQAMRENAEVNTSQVGHLPQQPLSEAGQ